jgi:hypothetical protein
MAREMKKPGSPKGTPGKAAGPAKAKATKTATKRPTGESPKRISGYADYLQERRPGISKSAAAAQAGKVRDKGFDVSKFDKPAFRSKVSVKPTFTDAEKAKLKKLTKASASGKLSMDQKMELKGLKNMQTKSRSYSPKPMSASAKTKAKAAGKATGAKTKPKSVASKVVSRAKTVAREVRDIPTAIGNINAVVRNTPGTTAKGGKPRQLKNAAKNIVKQVREVKKAAVTGKAQTPSKRYMTLMGDDPAKITGMSKAQKKYSKEKR